MFIQVLPVTCATPAVLPVRNIQQKREISSPYGKLSEVI